MPREVVRAGLVKVVLPMRKQAQSREVGPEVQMHPDSLLCLSRELQAPRGQRAQRHRVTDEGTASRGHSTTCPALLGGQRQVLGGPARRPFPSAPSVSSTSGPSGQTRRILRHSAGRSFGRG